MVDLTRGMRPQLNLSALVIFTMQLPLSAHSYSHYYNHILYEIQIQIQYVSMRVVCVCACVCWCLYCVHLITNFCCRLLSETLTSSSSSSFRVSHSHSRFSVGFFALLLFQYAIYKQTNIPTHIIHIHTYIQTYIRTYICRYMCKYLWVATYVHMRCSLGAQSLGCSGMWRSQQLFC